MQRDDCETESRVQSFREWCLEGLIPNLSHTCRRLTGITPIQTGISLEAVLYLGPPLQEIKTPHTFDCCLAPAS